MASELIVEEQLAALAELTLLEINAGQHPGHARLDVDRLQRRGSRGHDHRDRRRRRVR